MTHSVEIRWSRDANIRATLPVSGGRCHAVAGQDGAQAMKVLEERRFAACCSLQDPVMGASRLWNVIEKSPRAGRDHGLGRGHGATRSEALKRGEFAFIETRRPRAAPSVARRRRS